MPKVAHGSDEYFTHIITQEAFPLFLPFSTPLPSIPPPLSNSICPFSSYISLSLFLSSYSYLFLSPLVILPLSLSPFPPTFFSISL